MKLYRPVYLSIILLLISISSISMIWADEKSPVSKQQDVQFKSKQIDEPIPLSAQAKTIPISDAMIALQITIDDKEPFRATQCEGGMIRIEKESGEIFGVTPYITDRATNAISVKLFNIIRIIKAGKVIGEGIRELETASVSKESMRYMSRIPNNDSRISIQLSDVKESSKPRQKKEVSSKQPPGSQDWGVPEGTGTCCVTCNGVRICACAVEASCGSCCMGDCCN